MSENAIVKHLCAREFYESERDKIKLEHLSKELRPVILTLDGFFKTNDEGDLSVDDLSNLFFSTNRSKPEYYISVFEAVKANEASEDTTRKLIQGLQRVSKMRELSMLAYDAAEGHKSFESVYKFWEEEGLSVEKINDDSSEDIEFSNTDLVEILDHRRDLGGLRWRLDSLNKRLGSLRKGNFGFLFARPETGKTSFLSSEVTWMATQVKEGQGPIIWFNNEQVAAEVVLRWYQSTLGYTQTELQHDPIRCKERFFETTHGNLKLIDGASISKAQVEKVCSKYQPSLIVFDQIDKIQGFDNDREDLRLGAIYIWARELAKQYCPVIGVCQADGSGEGQRWLTMANVANAKTSKQAEADWILGIGRVNDVGYENLRYMHLSKNKLWGDEDTDPNLRHDRWETLIDPNIGRFIDL